MGGGREWVRFPSKTRFSFSLIEVRTGSGGHPASYSVGRDGRFPRRTAAGGTRPTTSI